MKDKLSTIATSSLESTCRTFGFNNIRDSAGAIWGENGGDDVQVYELLPELLMMRSVSCSC